MKSLHTRPILMASLFLSIFGTLLFLYSLGIEGLIHAFVFAVLVLSMLYLLRIKRNWTWIKRIIPLVLAILGVSGYIITLLSDDPGLSFGMGLLFAFSMACVVLSLVMFLIYQLLERGYYPAGSFKKTDESYQNNEWILFSMIVNMTLFQIIGYARGTEFLRTLLELIIVILVAILMYFVLFFINKKKKNIDLFSLVIFLFIGAYVGYAYGPKNQITFVVSTSAHLLMIYFLVKDYFNKRLDKKEAKSKR